MKDRDRIKQLLDYYDDEELHWAMYNSYDMIINNVDIRDVMVTDVEYFIHDITDVVTVNVIDTLIVYFEDLEEYEKCAELMEVRKNHE
tara:strand:- start:1544 stop:1807 length:264 start_codon:yes stop_codon:yes gene_type:complete